MAAGALASRMVIPSVMGARASAASRLPFSIVAAIPLRATYNVGLPSFDTLVLAASRFGFLVTGPSAKEAEALANRAASTNRSTAKRRKIEDFIEGIPFSELVCLLVGSV